MKPNLRDKYSEILDEYYDHFDSIELFHKNVINFFEARSLKKVVHSIRHRIKDVEHLLEKIERKNIEDLAKDDDKKQGPITKENVFKRITDMAGVRVLHLHQSQFQEIHRLILRKVANEDFVLFEEPKAYTYDPDSTAFFQNLGMITEQKDSFYTSIHYVLKPNVRSKVTCEVQIRTLLEEVWGEVDHTMNYPVKTTNEQCIENIRILARLISAGSHLADSIMRRYG
ncbi:hypothetical protein C3Y05_020005 [Aeromonas allosaccharophila]|uniref:(p)ppGpp synthetase n=1 Tax=Aeromonas allosaccharophila TaxID=656 RepID=UPI0013C6A09E|nr:(p)ppGpp synthetase [Aeromonas allosaccharophila]WDO01881.1 hypothetical protein C3Y05_020005 [Aeromonas allosaccharophila]